MPSTKSRDELLDLMRRMSIVQLGIAGVTRHKIRAIVGCDMNLVTEVMKHLDPKTARKIQKEGG